MPTLGQALADLRENLFVGRQTEIAGFERWLQEATDPPTILNVSGMGGSGKTELLHAFLRWLRQSGIPACYVDGRAARSSEADLAAALEPARRAPPSNDGRPSMILLVDTYEEIGAHDPWFRETFLSHLDASVRVVLAGRFPIDRLWMAAGGWAQLIRPLPIGPLTEAETLEYVQRRGIHDTDFCAQLWAFTHGHPLATCLATDLALRLGIRAFALAPQRYLVLQALSEQLLDEVEDRQFRDLLESAALVRQFDEEMLAALLGQDRAGDAFEQLSRLSVVRPVAHGLAVHDVVRRALADELRWRNPGRSAELRSRALSFYSTRFRAASPDDRHWLVADWLSFSTRALIQHLMFDQADPAEIIVARARSEDHPAIRRLRAERAVSQAARQWTMIDRVDDLEALLGTPLARLMVARTWDGEVVGYSTVIPICRATLALLLRNEPAARMLRERLEPAQLADPPASADDADTFVVWHLVPGENGPSSVQSALIRDWIGLFAQGKRYLALTALPSHQAFLTTLGFRLIPSACFDDYHSGHPLRGLELDLRSIGAERWVQAVLNGELPIDPTTNLSLDLQPAVQDVLSHWSDDAAVSASRLLRFADAGPDSPQRDRAIAVRQLVCHAFHEALEAAPESGRDVLRALDLAYLQRSTSHERVAERLSVSRSTLYRMLHRGCRLLAARIADSS